MFPESTSIRLSCYIKNYKHRTYHVFLQHHRPYLAF